jgi:hypothetical protein
MSFESDFSHLVPKIESAIKTDGNYRHYLKQHHNGAVDVSELSTHVAAWEQGKAADNLNYDERKNVHAALQQFHAPKMADLGVIDFDRQRGVLELTEEATDLDVYLAAVPGGEIPWGTYFLSLSALMTALVGAVLLGAYPFALVEASEWLLFVVVTFLVSSAVFAYRTRYAMRVGAEGPPPEVKSE